MSQVLICAAQARCAQLLNCINCVIPCVVGNTFYEAGNTATYSGAYSNGFSNACSFNTNTAISINNCANTFPNSTYISAVASQHVTCSSVWICHPNIKHFLELEPWNTSYYSAIPTLPGGSSTAAGTNPDTGSTYLGLKVCASSLACNAACTWTVPGGTKIARFQIWGPGGGAGMGCCCGGSPFGTTGAYASIIIPVVPGCQYVLCAGCACCCYMGWHIRTTPCRGSSSYVSGFGLSNFCAMGGEDVNICARYCRDMCNLERMTCGYYSATDCYAAGGGICNGGNDFCGTSSCASCGCIYFSSNQSTNFFGCYTGSAQSLRFVDCLTYGTQVAGINGINGTACWDTNIYMLFRHPPIYGFQSSSQCCICGSGSTIGGACWAYDHIFNNHNLNPGAGGTATAMFGGCTIVTDNQSTGCGGGRGRSGMVCVTYW